MSDNEHTPAPGHQAGIEERIAAAGQRIAALQRRLDEALDELAHARWRAAVELAQRQLATALVRCAPSDTIHGGHNA